MSIDRRSFLTWTAAAAGAAVTRIDLEYAPEIGRARRSRGVAGPEEVARDERYWRVVRRAYRPAPGFTNLESGYYSPEPQPVLSSRLEAVRGINRRYSHFMRRDLDASQEVARERLAEFAGADAGEVAIVRNTTEALNTVIMGLPLERGDRVICATREYSSMREALFQRRDRDGIVVDEVEVPFHPESDEQIVALYEKAIGERTRALLVSHLEYLTGHVLPVRKIADMAHAHGVEVICDAAHSFAHLDWRVPDLGCDYLGTSLHKWLAAPLGLGMLWVRKEKIPALWPLFGDVGRPDDDIRRFEHQGTRPPSAFIALPAAIEFTESIGRPEKEARLRYLKNRWAAAVREIDGVTLNTPLEDARSCAIANFRIGEEPPSRTAMLLMKRFKIFTVAVPQGVRVTPNLMNGPEEVDRLVAAVRELAAG